MSSELQDLPTPIPGEERPADEHANFITHALGLLLSLVASTVLMTSAIVDHKPIMVAACATYCVSLIGLYAASTLSHAFYDRTWRRFFRTLDQACIFLLIAGSFTPVAAVYLNHGWWPALPAAMWVLALFGVIAVMRVRTLTPTAQMAYLLLGWMPAISLKVLFDTVPFQILTWIIAGGVFYSVGTVFLRFDQHVRFLHALWHTFVIAGSICHYVAILWLLAMS